jgi:hypothetical protein
MQSKHTAKMACQWHMWCVGRPGVLPALHIMHHSRIMHLQHITKMVW